MGFGCEPTTTNLFKDRYGRPTHGFLVLRLNPGEYGIKQKEKEGFEHKKPKSFVNIPSTGRGRCYTAYNNSSVSGFFPNLLFRSRLMRFSLHFIAACPWSWPSSCRVANFPQILVSSFLWGKCRVCYRLSKHYLGITSFINATILVSAVHLIQKWWATSSSRLSSPFLHPLPGRLASVWTS